MTSVYIVSPSSRSPALALAHRQFVVCSKHPGVPSGSLMQPFTDYTENIYSNKLHFLFPQIPSPLCLCLKYMLQMCLRLQLSPLLLTYLSILLLVWLNSLLLQQQVCQSLGLSISTRDFHCKHI